LRRKLLASLLILTSLSLTLFVGLHTQPGLAVSSNPNARNVTLYWHYSTTPVSVGGIQTNYVLNSTSRFDFQTQQIAKQNSIYKGTGLASVVVDFYAYPNLAGPATLNGTWQVFVSANSSGYHPTIFNLRFREFPLGSGTATWDSGQINPIVTSSVGAYLDVPVYSYNLTTPTALGHTFAQSSTIDLSVTVNDGAAADSRIWYDSPSYQSKVILPVVNPGEPAKIWTADTTGSVKSTFPIQSQTVMISANVTDPFGGYDVNATTIGTKAAPVTLTLTGPGGSTLVSAQRMTQLTGGVAILNNLFQYNVSISGTAGNYTATVSSTDNSGNMEQLSYVFTLGTASPPGSPTTSTLILIGIIIGLIAVVVAFLALTQGRRKKTARDQPAANN
jgi:hypothetical protein